VKHFYTHRERCEALPGFFHWGAGLALTGRIRENGQTVLQSHFPAGSGSSPSYFHGQTVLQSHFPAGSGSSPSYFQIFFLIALLVAEFIINIIS